MGCKVELDKEPMLHNCIDFYKIAKAVYPRFKSEILIDGLTTVGYKKGGIPLMLLFKKRKGATSV